MYDLISYIFPHEQQALEALQAVLKKANRRYSKDRYQRYLRLWLLRLTVEVIQKKYHRFLYEREENLPADVLDCLSLEERLVLLLRDRRGLSPEEIAAVMRFPVGRVGRSLTYAREKVARELLRIDWYRGKAAGEVISLNSLLSRIEANLIVGAHESKGPSIDCSYHKEYMNSIYHSFCYVRDLKEKKFEGISNVVRNTKILPIFAHPQSFRWRDLSWQYKLAIESAGLVTVGIFAVVVLPWFFSRINTNAFYDGRLLDLFSRASFVQQQDAAMEEITTDRLLASADAMEAEAILKDKMGEDEFASYEFPSGDAETGAAPIAPSRLNAAVYRLIVQSPSVDDIIPQVKNLLSDASVKERDISGRKMPGGVYFDGITNEANYTKIRKAIEKLGFTKSYSTHATNRGPDERARLIVWIQQI